MLVGAGIFVQAVASSEIIWPGLPTARELSSVKDNMKVIVIVENYTAG